MVMELGVSPNICLMIDLQSLSFLVCLHVTDY